MQFDQAVADAAANEQKSEAAANELIAMRDRVSAQAALAAEYAADLALARDALRVAETQSAPTPTPIAARLDALVAQLEAGADCSSALYKRAAAEANVARLEEALLAEKKKREKAQRKNTTPSLAARDDDDADAETRTTSDADAESEIASLRLRLAELEASYDAAVRETRGVERDLRTQLAARAGGGARGATLEATKAALEARLADAEATLEAERARRRRGRRRRRAARRKPSPRSRNN